MASHTGIDTFPEGNFFWIRALGFSAGGILLSNFGVVMLLVGDTGKQHFSIARLSLVRGTGRGFRSSLYRYSGDWL